MLSTRPFTLPLLAAALLLPAALGAQQLKYEIEPSHSGVGFSVRHFFSQVPGKFDKFEGVLSFDPANPAAASVEVTIDAASINTGIANRDGHLRSADFLDTANFKTITFKSTKVTMVGKMMKGKPVKLRVVGDFTMKGITKPVTLDVTFNGAGKFSGEMLAGFNAKTVINRLDHKVEWNKAVEGTNVLGDEISIDINIEATEIKVETKPAA